MILPVFLFTILITQAKSSITEAVFQQFAIRGIDAETGRSVPMVRVTTVNGVEYYTDSAGWVAFDEPGLMDKDVFFHVYSHGYEYPKDRFGNRGVRLKTTPGTTARIEVKRKNIAERLYRLTGQGIYRDSVLLGKEAPIKQPTLNGDVLGQDTVQTAIYDDKIYWFWGDTNRPSYPLGQFKTSGATSPLPERGGLDPSLGVDLEYFVDDKGFSRQMAPVEGPGAVWLHGLFALKSEDKQQMIAHYARVKSLAHRYEHGLVLFNDRTQTFEKLVQFDDDVVLYPRGQSLAYEHGIDDYIYFSTPFPSVRVRADIADIKDPARYEAYTCLKPGTRYDKDSLQVERDESGNAVWDWKPDTDTIDARRQHALIQSGKLKESESRFLLSDPDGEAVYLHAGSVHWNEYRDKWIMIAEQLGGKTSFIGEMWYAEADRIEGPWENARHIVTHDKYSFYNPAHHPFFDQQGGRLIYFEGTYANTFSAAKVPTPRYNYNQIMYRLDLAHPRLKLPANR